MLGTPSDRHFGAISNFAAVKKLLTNILSFLHRFKCIKQVSGVKFKESPNFLFISQYTSFQNL